MRVGDHVLDVGAVERAGLIEAGGTLQAGTLNPFLALGRPHWTAIRERLVELLTGHAYQGRVAPLLVPLADVTPRLPFEVGDYVDFYSSIEHATNLGKLFRPGARRPRRLAERRTRPLGFRGIVPSRSRDRDASRFARQHRVRRRTADVKKKRTVRL